MSEAPPDIRALARRYLDLWQDQMTAMAHDPALAEALAQGVTTMTQVSATLLQAATAGAASPVNQARKADAGSSSAPSDSAAADAPSGSASAADAPAVARVDDDGLAHRLAALEERIAALEARLGERGGDPAPKPGRRRPGRMD
ncbi:MAG TPA: hypothetical protein VK196_19075 [Magnetospirillum sp.]|nr:hypothetical protein [Magnetospirillum sp.]